ncbi:MAG: hypothetical protein ACOC3J_05060 [Gemmatimonadota bacterium]
MKQLAMGVVGAAVLALAVPTTAEGQEAGWWEWALGEVAGVRADAVLDRDRGKIGDRRRPSERDDEARRGGTLSDIILGRTGETRRGDRGDRRDRDDRYEDRRGADRGPKFCRTGEGHPVFGRSWCRDKGFGDYGRGGVVWRDRGWEDIILGAPRDRERRSGVVNRGGLIDILGDVVLGRLEGERRRIGGGAPLEGRWLQLSNGGRVLQVRSGALPIAELSDLDGDGRVDAALVPRR